MNTHPSQEGRCGIGLILYACVVHVCHVYLVRMCTDLYIISVPRVFIHSVNLHWRSHDLTHAHVATVPGPEQTAKGCKHSQEGMRRGESVLAAFRRTISLGDQWRIQDFRQGGAQLRAFV